MENDCMANDRPVGEPEVGVTGSRKTIINKRVQARYDELMREGKHGHYETMFRVVHEELTRCANESYTRGMVDQFYDPLSASSIERLNDKLGQDRAETIIGKLL